MSFEYLIFLIMLLISCVSAYDDKGVVSREIRETPPATYVLKVQSFSHFSTNGVDQIVSNNFQVGDHQWKIVLFPNGSGEGKGDYVSMHLKLESSSSLPAGEALNAIFKFFLFDQIRGNYLTVQGRARRFDRLKYEWGFDEFISLKDFEQPTNGYLVDDTSFFGVEIFVSEGSRLGESHSISEVANITGKYKWIVTQFSALGEQHYSDEFVVGGYRWKIMLDPEGYAKHKGFSLSMYLVSVDSKSSTTEHKVKAEFELTLKNSKQDHRRKKTTIWFGATRQTWGWASFIELKDLKDNKKGYVSSDLCIIEAEVTVLSEISQKILKC